MIIKKMILAVLLLVVLSSVVVAADSKDDCNWLCQVITWFTGSGKVVGKT